MIFLHTLTVILTIFFAFMVAFSSNPMNSIIFLIGIFFNSFIIMFYFNIEFLGLLFILIYVGAIAILFLFVIMMLNLKSAEINVLNIDFISKTFLVVIFIYLCFFGVFHFFDSLYADSENFLLYKELNAISNLDIFYNINSIGQTLFNYFNGCFLVAGLILLTALVGAIALSQNFRQFKGVESASSQLSRHRNATTNIFGNFSSLKNLLLLKSF